MMEKFFSDYKKSIVNSIRVAELGTIASVKGSTADINVQGYPLLVDVPLIDTGKDVIYSRGDRVLVVFAKGDINGAVAVGGGISTGSEGSSQSLNEIRQAIEELELTKANKSELKKKVSELENIKANKEEVVTSINGQKGNVTIDIPSLEQVENDIKNLQTDKADKKKLEEEITRLEAHKADKDNVVTSINGKKGDVELDKFIQFKNRLPTAEEKYRGAIFIVTENNTDIPYICLKDNGLYRWERLLGGFI